MLSAAVLFTLLNLLIKKIGGEYGPWQIGFYRFLGSIAVLMAIFGRKVNIFVGVDQRLLILRGLCGSIAFVFYIMAIRSLPLSTAVVIFYSFPAFAALFAFLFYREQIGLSQIVCIMAVLVGVGILLGFRLGGDVRGQLFSLTSGIFGGLTITLIRALRKKNGPVVIYFYFCLLGTIVCLPGFISHPVFPSTIIEGAMLCAMVLVSVFGQLLMNEGFYYCRGWEGGVFMSGEVVFTAITGILLLHDPVNWRFWLGGGMIMGSVIALNLLLSSIRRTVSPLGPMHSTKLE
jgi:drug/metabolite transporter (DMT)-like permease